MKASNAKHLMVAIDEKRQLVSYVCEFQPMATIRSYGHPSRCPFCRRMNPVTPTESATERQSDQEKR
jgi:hypothetical protein